MTVMPQDREIHRKTRRRIEKGVPGGRGPERGGGHVQHLKALSLIPLTGLAERDGAPGRDPKTRDDQGKCTVNVI